MELPVANQMQQMPMQQMPMYFPQVGHQMQMIPQSASQIEDMISQLQTMKTKMNQGSLNYQKR